MTRHRCYLTWFIKFFFIIIIIGKVRREPVAVVAVSYDLNIVVAFLWIFWVIWFGLVNSN